MKLSRWVLLIIVLIFCRQVSAQNRFATGLDFDENSYQKTPKKARLTRALSILPPQASIKQYAPYPKSQGQYGTCVAWSTAYCGRTIIDAVKNNWTDRTYITDHAYSPAFLFRMLNPNDAVCKGGAVMQTAFDLMKYRGDVTYQALPVECVQNISNEQMTLAGGGKIKDYVKLFDSNSSANLKIQSVKKSITEKSPVAIGMLCPVSFQTAKEYWQPTESPEQIKDGHAMCVVGYNDNQYGGAFEIQNSWGDTWGNEGYIWIRYADFARFVYYAFEYVEPAAIAPTTADLSGELKLVLSSGEQMPANLLVSTRGLKVVAAKRTPEPLTIYQTQQSYTSGTNFRIYISNNEPAYVYAISSDLSNEVTKIFPYEPGISAALSYKKNDVALPDEDHYIQFDNKAGKDFLCVLYSKNELNIDQLVAQIGSGQGSFNQKVYNALGTKLVDPANVSFNNDKIGFKGFSKGKDVIALMVELDHK